MNFVEYLYNILVSDNLIAYPSLLEDLKGQDDVTEVPHLLLTDSVTRALTTESNCSMTAVVD